MRRKRADRSPPATSAARNGFERLAGKDSMRLALSLLAENPEFGRPAAGLATYSRGDDRNRPDAAIERRVVNDSSAARADIARSAARRTQRFSKAASNPAVGRSMAGLSMVNEMIE